MNGNSEGFIGILCAIALACLATYGITEKVQTQRELERIQIEYRGYQDGVKDSHSIATHCHLPYLPSKWQKSPETLYLQYFEVYDVPTTKFRAYLSSGKQ